MAIGDRVLINDSRLLDGYFEGALEEIGLYAEGDLGDLWATLTLRTPLSKARMRRQEMRLKGPVGGVKHPERLEAKDLLVDCVVHHDGANQVALMGVQKFTHRGLVQQWLDRHPTRVTLRLKNLNPDAQLNHGWCVDVG